MNTFPSRFRRLALPLVTLGLALTVQAQNTTGVRIEIGRGKIEIKESQFDLTPSAFELTGRGRQSRTLIYTPWSPQLGGWLQEASLLGPTQADNYLLERLNLPADRVFRGTFDSVARAPRGLQTNLYAVSTTTGLAGTFSTYEYKHANPGGYDALNLGPSYPTYGSFEEWVIRPPTGLVSSNQTLVTLGGSASIIFWHGSAGLLGEHEVIPVGITGSNIITPPLPPPPLVASNLATVVSSPIANPDWASAEANVASSLQNLGSPRFGVAAVPEPTVMALALLGAAGLAVTIRRRR